MDYLVKDKKIELKYQPGKGAWTYHIQIPNTKHLVGKWGSMKILKETDRLLIRPIRINDAAFLLELLNTKGWLEFIGDRNVRDIESANNYIQNIILNNKNFYHIFEIKDSKFPIGI